MNTATTNRTVRSWIAATLLVGALLRVAGWFALKGAFFCGIPEFVDAVHRVRAFHLLNASFPELEMPWGSPVYPYLLALIAKVLGEGIGTALLVQGLVGVATGPLLAWALAPVLGSRERWIAAFLYAASPMAVFLEMRLQPTVWAVPLALVCLRWLFYDGHRRADVSGLAGLLLGLGFLFRPFMFLALAVGAVWTRLRPAANGDGPRRAWGAAVVLTIAFLVLPVVMSAYNATLQGGGPAWNWSHAREFHETLDPDTWGTARSGVPPAWTSPAQAKIVVSEMLARPVDEWETLEYYWKTGLQTLVEHPLRFVASVVRRAGLLLSGHEIPDPVSPTVVLGRAGPHLSWGLHLFPLLLGLGAIGLWRLRDARARAPLLVPLVALAAANLLVAHSCTSRWFSVVALLPFSATGLAYLPALVRETLKGTQPRYALPVAIGLVLLPALDLPRAGAHVENASEDLRYEAFALLRAQDRKAAMSRLRSAVRIDPGNAMAHTDLANLLAKEELVQAARAEFEAALSADSTCAGALYGLSEVLRMQGLLEEADSAAVRLVVLHPNQPLYLNQLAVVSMSRGNLSRARFLLERALDISPQYQVAIINLRTVERAEREAPQLAFPEEMTPPPESELWGLGMGALQALGAEDWDTADSLTSAGLERNPEELLALYLRGAFLLEAERPEEATPLLVRLVQAAPGRVMTTDLATKALRAAGRRAEARELLVWSLERADDDRNRFGLETLLRHIDEED